MSNFNILVIEDQEGLDSKSTSYRVAQTTSSDDKTNSKEVTKMKKILNAIGLREMIWVIILVIVVMSQLIFNICHTCGDQVVAVVDQLDHFTLRWDISGSSDHIEQDVLCNSRILPTNRY